MARACLWSRAAVAKHCGPVKGRRRRTVVEWARQMIGQMGRRMIPSGVAYSITISQARCFSIPGQSYSTPSPGPVGTSTQPFASIDSSWSE